MIRKKNYPIVLLVGRMNVGKSALFNRLSNTTKSIVFDKEGVTRDYIHETIEWNDKTFTLVDTGGLRMTRGNKEEILQKVKENVFDLFDKATLFLFVCDVKTGVTQEDQIIAQQLHKTKKPVALLLNKSDNKNLLTENRHDFLALGFETILPVSAIHGFGIVQLFDFITTHLCQTPIKDEEETAYSVAIIGKPNVGKSSLMNLLIKEERSIVSPIPGTTREPITEKIHFYQQAIELTDTAGLRRKSKIDEPLETLMARSSLQSIQSADIVLIVFDASQAALSQQEFKLIFYAFEQKKSIIVLFNKTDLLTPDTKDLLQNALSEYEYFFKKVPCLWISCKTEKNVGTILAEIKQLWERQHQHLNSTQVNEIVQGYLSKKPLFHKTNRIKIFKIRHVSARIPTFVLHVNHPEWLNDSHLGFIENILRKHYNFKGCPINFALREG